MPGTNGYQLTRSITRDPRYSDVPVIMCTSKGQETDRVWGLRQGARDYVVKPVDTDDLMAKIKSLGSHDDPLAPPVAASQGGARIGSGGDPRCPVRAVNRR